MLNSKKICPFTDKACTACGAVFADGPREKHGEKLRGCHLIEKTPAGKGK